MRTNLDANSANSSPADFLKVRFHVFTALLRVKHIVALTVNRPFRAFDCARRTSPDTFIA